MTGNNGVSGKNGSNGNQAGRGADLGADSDADAEMMSDEAFADNDEPQLPVATDHWVSLSYELFDSTGEPLEEVRRNLTYLHGGYGEVLPKIETAVDGRLVGDEVSLYLEPDDAFGDYDADIVMLLPAERLPADLDVGMTFDGIPGEAADGNVYSVTDIAQGHVVLDGNHPLAGISVRYEIRVEEVREADEEDIEREKLAASQLQQ